MLHRASNVQAHLAAVFASLSMLTASTWGADAFQITPTEINLQGNFARVQAVITKLDETGNAYLPEGSSLAFDPPAKVKPSNRSEDLTTTAMYASSDSKVFTVNSSGALTALATGPAN